MASERRYMVADSDWERLDIIRLIHLREYCIRLRQWEDIKVFRWCCLILRFVIGFNTYYRESTHTRLWDHWVTA